MADLKIAYAASSAVTISLNAVGSSSTWVAGRGGLAVDNTTDKYLDYLLAGKVRVGTSPVAATEIRVYVLGLMEDATYPDVFDGTDGTFTLTSVGVGRGFLKLAAIMSVDTNTNDRNYYFGPVSVANLFGGQMPKKFQVFVTHNTNVNLHASGPHVVSITPVYQTAA